MNEEQLAQQFNRVKNVIDAWWAAGNYDPDDSVSVAAFYCDLFNAARPQPNQLIVFQRNEE